MALERTVSELNLAKEQAENAREAAERASETKEQFLRLMSHELRTPLQSIMMSTHVLREDLSNPQVTAQRLRRIDLAVRTLSDMIDDVVDSARIVTGQLLLDCRSMDLAFVIRSAVELMIPVAEIKQITLITDIKADAVPMMGDPERLRECVCNLLENAIKFSAKGGEVRISLRRLTSSAEVQVTDRGEGIAPEFLLRVFDRFAQASPSTQRRSGLGLGLSIAKHIVELHSGKIVAESEGKNRGARFTIRLPYRLSTTSQPHA
jgi:signal transduction histidine kinase